MKELEKKILKDPYNGYMYSYPHKKAYRYLDKVYTLEEVWKDEEMNNITLYIHIPFCKVKCAYCNLLSTNKCNNTEKEEYLRQLRNEMRLVKASLMLTKDSIDEVVIGGGTPLYLPDKQLENLLENIKNIFNLDFKNLNIVIEASPDTLTKNKMKILKDYFVKRISVGIQSFDKLELETIGRRETYSSLNNLKKILFKEKIYKNIDLIYGILDFDAEIWKYSLEETLKFNPEEIFIYPLYIRDYSPLKGNYSLDKNLMMEKYQFAVNYLKEKGYHQASMRNFVRSDMKDTNLGEFAGIGRKMIGIGCGARSYTNKIHYSSEYYEKEENMKKAILKYISGENLGKVYYGIIPTEDDWKRRFLMRGLLNVMGLDIEKYQENFGTSPKEDFDEIEKLETLGYIIADKNNIKLTSKGLMYSDSIGNLFISSHVRKRMETFNEEELL